MIWVSEGTLGLLRTFGEYLIFEQQMFFVTDSGRIHTNNHSVEFAETILQFHNNGK